VPRWPMVLGRPARATPTAVALFAAAAVVTTSVAAVAASLPWHTTYAAFSSSILVTDAVAAVVLLAAGAALWWEQPQDVRATLLVLASAAWACANWVGWQGGPVVARTLGAVGLAALLPLVTHLVVRTWPGWHSLRAAVPWLYGVTLGLVVARLAVADPRVDPSCWQNCTANVLLVTGNPPLAASLLRISLAVTILTGAALVAAGCGLAVAGRHAARRHHLPVLLPAAAYGGALAVQCALVLGGSVETPLDRRFVVVHLAMAGALVGIGVGAGLVVMRSRRARRRTEELARNLVLARDQPVAGLLSRATGDPTVRVTYRVREADGWVNAAGRRVAAPHAGLAGGLVPVTRTGELIAVISHDRETTTDIDMAAALGPAARLAIENESLQAQQRTRLQDLQDSQRRIVDAADAQRARLERNLHDGAQVSVLGVIDTVQRALRAARRDSNTSASRLLSGAAEEAQATIDDLRVLARGIHPAILDLEGLGPALEALADHAPIRVEVVMPDHERLPSAVEHAVYHIAAETIREAARRDEDDLLVRVQLSEDWIKVVVDGTRQDPTDAVRDRVGALGGVVVDDTAVLEVRLPCA
jgi:signal transduction histidine kinase